MKVSSPATEWQFDETLEGMIASYRKDRRPVDVDFRAIVPFGSGIDRATHLVHSYPAKLLPNIPIFFLGCRSLIAPSSLVYDPFCGTGTVLVEAILSGHRAAGADANPLARLITSAKTTWIEKASIAEEVKRVEREYDSAQPREFAPVVDPHKWFSGEAQLALGKLAEVVDRTSDQELRTFLQVAFSQVVRKVSNADPRNSVPVIRSNLALADDCDPPSALDLFTRTALANARRLADLPRSARSAYVQTDARQPLSHKVTTTGADLVITSPPYAGAQKYIRASSLSIGWLGLAPNDRLRSLERLNIGREHLTQEERRSDWGDQKPETRSLLARIAKLNPERAHIFGTYLTEMAAAAKAIVASVRNGGHVVLVMGDNSVSGVPVRTSAMVREIFEDEGLSLMVELVDDIKSRGLMTKRNKTSGLITQEHVFLFRK